MARDEPVAARTRFLRAVYLLAVGTESLQGRVGAAWLEVVALRREDLPPRLHEAFGAVGAAVLAAPDDPAAPKLYSPLYDHFPGDDLGRAGQQCGQMLRDTAADELIGRL